MLLQLDLGLVELLRVLEFEGLELMLVVLALLEEFGLEDGGLGVGELEVVAVGLGELQGFEELQVFLL